VYQATYKNTCNQNISSLKYITLIDDVVLVALDDTVTSDENGSDTDGYH
jgi:hypothetical protein